MTIRFKLLVIFIIITIIPISILGILSYHIGSNIINDTTLRELDAISKIQKTRINGIINEDVSQVNSLIANKTLQESLNLYLQHRDPGALAEMKDFLSLYILPDNFKSLAILDADGNVIVSTDNSQQGKNHSGTKDFTMGKKGIYLEYEKGSIIHVSAPIIKNDKLTGVLIALCDDFDSFNKVINDYTGIGRTGETFLVRDDGKGNAIFLMPRKYEKDPGSLNIIPKDRTDVPAIQAINRNKIVMKDARDYRNVGVVAATGYIELINCGLVVKIDKAEAYAPVLNLMYLIILISLLSFVLAIVLAVSVSRSISLSITKLKKSAENVSTGNLDIRVGSKSNDEIGQFSRVFDQMLDSIKNKTTAIETLNNEVKSRKIAEGSLKETSDYLQNLITYANAPIIVWDDRFRITHFNHAFESLTGRKEKDVIGSSIELLFPDELVKSSMALLQKTMSGERIELEEINIRHKDGSIRNVVWNTATIFATDNKAVSAVIAQGQDVTERKKVEKSLKDIEWLLSRKPEKKMYTQSYGDLSDLNSSRLILDSVGRETLTSIVSEYLDLLETSAAVYEKNGDYALGIFSSGWCKLIDSASYRFCCTTDNAEALKGGKWGCHESCWSCASRKSIETGEPVDIECYGGIRLYAVPVRTSTEIIGSINVGYGNPPSDINKLWEISLKTNIPLDDLVKSARAYNPRPMYIIELAKARLLSSANLIGEIVERKQAEKSLRETTRYLQNLFSYANAPIIVWDMMFKITQFNKAFEHLTGRKAKDVIGKSIEILFPPHLTEKTMQLIRTTMTGERWEVVEINIQHIDGNIRTVLWNSATIMDTDDKTPVAVIAQGQDITERIYAENKIKAIAWDLQERKKELEISNKELESFSYSVSHDLRSPLRSIQGFSQILLDEYNNLLDQKGRETLNRVCNAAQRMGELIDDILNLSRVTRIKMIPAEVNLSNIADEIFKNIKQEDPARIVEFSIEPDMITKGDEHLLRILIGNLLNNAWKFTSRNPVARITFGTEGNSVEKIYFIKDNGVGFDMNYVDKLFSPFQRLHTNEEFEGSGIGLTIVDRIIHRHNGRIWVESVINEGTTFYFTLNNSMETA